MTLTAPSTAPPGIILNDTTDDMSGGDRAGPAIPPAFELLCHIAAEQVSNDGFHGTWAKGRARADPRIAGRREEKPG
jgi:hypothetical protein